MVETTNTKFETKSDQEAQKEGAKERATQLAKVQASLGFYFSLLFNPLSKQFSASFLLVCSRENTHILRARLLAPPTPRRHSQRSRQSSRLSTAAKDRLASAHTAKESPSKWRTPEQRRQDDFLNEFGGKIGHLRASPMDLRASSSPSPSPSRHAGVGPDLGYASTPTRKSLRDRLDVGLHIITVGGACGTEYLY